MLAVSVNQGYWQYCYFREIGSSLFIKTYLVTVYLYTALFPIFNLPITSSTPVHQIVPFRYLPYLKM